MQMTQGRFESLFSAERLSTYLSHCDGNFDAAVRLYRRNAADAAAFWRPVGHLEVAIRNALSNQIARRHNRLGRSETWLDDPDRELTTRARAVIQAARTRVNTKGKQASYSQTISELSFGFWRFLIAKRSTAIWPDLASAFPNAPDRKLETVEAPVSRIYEFRNRLAHHEPIWNRDPQSRYDDVMMCASYIDSALPEWIEADQTRYDLFR